MNHQMDKKIIYIIIKIYIYIKKITKSFKKEY